MKFKKNIIVIIPALAKNRYSSSGDLHQWGGSTLLEWKISQAKKLKYIKDIYVATPDEVIKKICKKLNVKIYSRYSKDSLRTFHQKISKKFIQNYLLHLYPTSPFLSPNLINKTLITFEKHKNKFDSLCTVQKKNDYFFYNKNSINFNFKKN
jgi:CMP-N-acetylneuraminic acid synthetase